MRAFAIPVVMLFAAAPLAAQATGTSAETATAAPVAPVGPRLQASRLHAAAARKPAAQGSGSDSALVRAAKASNAIKKNSKPITNDDVKKSKGHLIFLTDARDPLAATRPAEEQQKALRERLKDEHDKQQAYSDTQRSAQRKLDDAKGKVKELGDQMTHLESAYYQAQDPGYRDGVLQKKWEAMKREHEKAKDDLAAAQKEYEEAMKAPRPH